jgi:hypothetical protein
MYRRLKGTSLCKAGQAAKVGNVAFARLNEGSRVEVIPCCWTAQFFQDEKPPFVRARVKSC